MRVYFKASYLPLLLTLIVGAFIMLTPKPTQAVSASDWRAGNIIDDGLFYSNNDMSADQIQAFLNSKVPVCDTWGTKPSELGGGTRAQYAASKGYSTPFTCLKDYSMTTPGYSADGYCGAINGGLRSAAQIIKDVSSACGIGSKVLLVLLQKEQGFVTDEWPLPNQYQKATGYACPDTAPCDSQYAGFFNQVYRAARIYKVYRANPNSGYRYKARQNNSVLWNVESTGCGGGNVYIENDATAGLYIYTPYQPNQAALNNMYGTGDRCSAYGNRNFWRMYSDWFGNPNAPSFRASYHSQSSYPVIDTGQAISVFFQFKNTGSAFWKDDLTTFPGYHPVRMANSSPINRGSMFRANNWASPSRPTGFFSAVYESDGVTKAADQHTAYPGQIARFEFTINVDPSIQGGVYREYFQPVLEGASNWDMGTWAYIDIGVNHPNYKAGFHSQAGYPTLNRGSSTYTFIRYTNTGNEPWYDDESVFPGKTPIHLATTWPINRASWFTGSRPALKFYKVLLSDGVTLAPNQHVVRPGQMAEFAFTITAPSNMPTGVYKEYFEVVAEGAPWNKWSIGPAAWLQVTVN